MASILGYGPGRSDGQGPGETDDPQNSDGGTGGVTDGTEGNDQTTAVGSDVAPGGEAEGSDDTGNVSNDG